MPDLRISLVLLASDDLAMTEACVESLRLHAEAPIELVVVREATIDTPVSWIRDNADRVVLTSETSSWAGAMNRGLAASTGTHVAFVDDAVRVNSPWVGTVIEDAETHANAGCVLLAPAVGADTTPTMGGLAVVGPFSLVPPLCVPVVRTEVLRRLGGWDERYSASGAATLDLAFAFWCNGLEVLSDTRVAFTRESPTTPPSAVDPHSALSSGLEEFIERWTTGDRDVMRLEEFSEDLFRHNLAHAAEAASWLRSVMSTRGPSADLPELARRYLDARDVARRLEEKNSALIMERQQLKAQLRVLANPPERAPSRPLNRATRLMRRVGGKIRRSVVRRSASVGEQATAPPPSAQSVPDPGVADSSARVRYERALERLDFSGEARRSVVFEVSTTNLDAGRGDLFVALGLGRELERIGYEVMYLGPESWYQVPLGCDLVVAMLPDFDPSRLPQRVTAVAWVRNETERWLQQSHLGFFDLVLCSSGASEHAVRTIFPGLTAILPIGVDTGLFIRSDAVDRAGVSTTVNQWGMEREVYSGLRAAPIDFPLEIYGRGKGFPSEVLAHWRGSVSYFELPAIYARSLLVLDDFNHTTAGFGNVNSRVFEALAAGALPVTNRRAGLQEVGLGEVPTYTGRHGLLPLVRRLIDDPATAALADRLSAHVRSSHSFERRAADFDALTKDLAPAVRTTVVTVAAPSSLIEEWYPDMAAAGGWLLHSSSAAFPVDVARGGRFGPSILHLLGTDALHLSGSPELPPERVEKSLRECLEQGAHLVLSATDPGDGKTEIPGLAPPTLAEWAAVYHPMSAGPDPAMTLPIPDPWLAARRAQRHALGVDPGTPTCLIVDVVDVTPYQEAFRRARESSPELRLVVAGEVGPATWQPADGVICRLHPLHDRNRLELIAAADVVITASNASGFLGTVHMAEVLACPVGAIEAGPRVEALGYCTWLHPDELASFLRDAKPRGQVPYASLSESVLAAVAGP